MFLEGNRPRWFSMRAEDLRGPLRLRFKIRAAGLPWFSEEKLVSNSFFVGCVTEWGWFAHLAKTPAPSPFGFGGIGTSRRMQDHALVELPLSFKSAENVSRTLCVISEFLSLVPENQALKPNAAQQTLVFRTSAEDRLQGRNIVAQISPRALKRIAALGSGTLELFCRRVEARVKQVWEALDSPNGSADGRKVDPFQDLPFQLKENWCVISCPGNRTSLATKKHHVLGSDRWLMFSGCNIDSCRQQLALLSGAAELCRNLELTG
jgi:hypothetical protein